jgi:hypothetical protein
VAREENRVTAVEAVVDKFFGRARKKKKKIARAARRAGSGI